MVTIVVAVVVVVVVEVVVVVVADRAGRREDPDPGLDVQMADDGAVLPVVPVGVDGGPERRRAEAQGPAAEGDLTISIAITSIIVIVK